MFTLAYKYRETGEVKEQRLSGLFVQIVLLPNSNFQNGIFERTQQGKIIIDKRGNTTAPAIFSAHDLPTVLYKQIVIAMGKLLKQHCEHSIILLKKASDKLDFHLIAIEKYCTP